MAMYVREHAQRALEGSVALARTFLDQARLHLDWPMPGYTHLQRAQPVYLAHHLLAYVWMLVRDRDRFAAVLEAVRSLPLGAGALAGVNFDTDRAFVAAELGFAGVAENSIDAVSNRDFVLDYLAAAATCATHLSKLGAELVLWSSEEFGFLEVSDAWASGSSLMPQKKNPDVAELARGKSGRLVGNATGLLTTLKGLPLAYNRDLQEDKEPVLDSVDTLEVLLPAFTGMVRTLRLDTERMAELAPAGFSLATDVAEWLVREGVPFRTAHEVAGAAVRRCEELGVELDELTDEQLADIDARLTPGVHDVLTVEGSVGSRDARGGTAPQRVAEQLAELGEAVAEHRAWVG
jgi:argininosuccinate lyase